jgi:hemerythrin-like domain-containing protein
MAEARYAPRKMEFEALVDVLVEEHEVMREGLRRAEDSADRRNYEAVVSIMRKLEPIFRQHIADEEAQILRLLIGELGVKGAEEEIAVFQQHRPIHRLMQIVTELASKSAVELEADQARLDELFSEHTAAEEGSVFPRAMSCYRGKTKGGVCPST